MVKLNLPDGVALLIALGAIFCWTLQRGSVLGNDENLVARDEPQDQFWSFRRLNRPQQPDEERLPWARNPIDVFVGRRLELNGLSPNPSAHPVALLRRVHFDLTGIPPSLEEVDRFSVTNRRDALERVVDRLLASPHYGERWARHWLDLVRYAETNSYERDGPKPFVWRYRDYVIRALNQDMPYDRFVREQLAGDELESTTLNSFVATGYYRLGIWQDEPVDQAQELYEDLDDIVRTTAEVFLGMTIGCARCHDHKLDPLPQPDYYRFLAFFRNIRRYEGPENVLTVSRADVDELTSEEVDPEELAIYEKNLLQNRQQMAALEALVKDRLTGGEKDDFQFEVNRLDILENYVDNGVNKDQIYRYKKLIQQRKKIITNPPWAGKTKVMYVTEHGAEAAATHVLHRGNVHAPGEKVEPGFPAVLGFTDPIIASRAANSLTCGRRYALAEWIVAPDNPLTARVMANRLWQYHLGRGIVRSPNNFGFQGTPPTHPKLLDWLASELMSCEWQLKHMHRFIVLSNTYRMSSWANEVGLDRDPENQWFWRFDMRRLSAEEVRDSILWASGSLNTKLYGQSIYPKISNEVKAGQSRPGIGWDDSDSPEQNRRSVYIHGKRSLVVPLLEAFDGPDVDATCPVRFVTVQPTQSLAMMNSQFLLDQASALAADVRRLVGSDPARQVVLILRRAIQRQPEESEIQQGMQLLDSLQEQNNFSQEQALEYYCLLVLNLNEFIFLD